MPGLNWCQLINFWCHLINIWGHVLLTTYQWSSGNNLGTCTIWSKKLFRIRITLGDISHVYPQSMWTKVAVVLPLTGINLPVYLSGPSPVGLWYTSGMGPKLFSWHLQGDFLTPPPPEFAKCWPVRNWFQKMLRVPDWPAPQMIGKHLSVWQSEYDSNF